MARRLSQLLRELKIGADTAIEFLSKKNQPVADVNAKLTDAQEDMLYDQFATAQQKEERKQKAQLAAEQKAEQQEKAQQPAPKEEQNVATSIHKPKILGTLKDGQILPNEQKKEEPKVEQQPKQEPEKEVKQEPKKEPKQEPKEEPVKDSKPEVKSEEKPKTEPKEPKQEPKKEPKKEQPKQEKKPANEPKQESKPQPKQEPKQAPKQEPKQELKQESVKEQVAEQEPVKKEAEPFRLNHEPALSLKVMGKIDLDSLNQSTRPQKSDNKKNKDKKNKGNNNNNNNRPKDGKNENKEDRERRKRVGQSQKVDIAKEVANNNKKKDDKKKDDKKKDEKRNQPKNEQHNDKSCNNNERNNRSNNDSRGSRDNKDHRRNYEDDSRDYKDIHEEIKRGGDNRKKKREQGRRREEEIERRAQQESTILRITDIITPNELATLMNQPVEKVISTCFMMGEMVSINQRLRSREVIEFVASEYNYQVEFISADEAIKVDAEVDNEEDMLPRPPVVTVMGHVDHGKTSLLDYIRKTNVIAGEAGGITQHIGAYNVTLENGRQITFIDTPGHEAFTAMRARGAKITDIAIIIVAADDDVMPQTDEAISHASAAGVPIVFAINKIDKPGANPEKVKESLANRNYLVEDWGGSYQSQDISAKKGIGVQELLEKVLLQADIMELKANPNRKAVGSVIESSLDKGRGYVATVLVQKGTLKVGDVVLAGTSYGRVRAMYNERNQKITKAGPSEPVILLGLNGAPQAGDEFHVFNEDREARELANKRLQLIREQGVHTQKGMDLDEIARRAAIGNFQEINLIVKGDVDGSIEALTDSFIKLSTPEIQINVIHKAVGQISESDVALAMASDNAMIIGFQVRPSSAARKLADTQGVAIHTYSIIYDAIEELKSAMEGMLAPTIKEEVVALLEVRQTFRISKVGTIAGCMVKEGKIRRTSQVRVIRDGIVVHTGSLASLKREKDDVREVSSGFECGVNLNSYNDIVEGDILEAFEQIEVKKTL